MVEVAHILLVLPDNRVVLQRRDSNAPTSPNKLALFGGGVEPGESPDGAMRRELGEETSLDPTSLPIRAMGKLALTCGDGTVTRFSTYRVDIPSADFEVYEGSGAESYAVSEVLARDDLVPSARYALMELGG